MRGSSFNDIRSDAGNDNEIRPSAFTLRSLSSDCFWAMVAAAILACNALLSEELPWLWATWDKEEALSASSLRTNLSKFSVCCFLTSSL